jgi:uncharacterized membrane protein YecN with MAPEG domain
LVKLNIRGFGGPSELVKRNIRVFGGASEFVKSNICLLNMIHILEIGILEASRNKFQQSSAGHTIAVVAKSSFILTFHKMICFTDFL